MEAPVQPEKKKSNILLIVVVAVLVACCCGVLIIGGILTLGGSLLNFSSPQFDTPAIPEIPELPQEIYDPNIPQGGLGDNDLRLRVWDFITPMAEEDAGCENPLPAATVIVVTEQPEDGTWTEGWTLFCENGVTPVFRIIFSTNPDGTINFSPGLISK